MKSRKRILVWIARIILVYLGICLLYYFIQERFIFHPKSLSANHVFNCDKDFEELTISTSDGFDLHGVLVKPDSSKGLILFLHGSGSNIDKYISKRKIASTYADLGYDTFLLDYRGYGKSEGKIKNEEQFTDDLDRVYSYLTKIYDESEIVIIGFSLGTFAGAYLASKNNPKLLVLESAGYSGKERLRKRFFFLPLSILSKYELEAHEYLRKAKVPTAIFMGSEDPLTSENRWHQVLKPEDTYTILQGELHTDFSHNEQYIDELKTLLGTL
jgi:pimeloyl-ACP methyl ester carboxylesterase